MEPVAVAPPALAATAAWRPMAFGDRAPSLIPNPLYEPLWPGHRAIVEVSGRGVSVRDVDLGPLAGGPGVLAAIAAANLAEELVVDGYLVAAPLDRALAASQSGSGEITMREIFRQGFIGGLGRSPSRDAKRRPTPTQEPLPAGAPIAFVAVDLLWVDGQSLLDVPLGERKRLLESVIADGELVQKVVPVLAPVEPWHGRWRALGFKEVAVKGLNSRYQPGGISIDWTIAAIPR